MRVSKPIKEVLDVYCMRMQGEVVYKYEDEIANNIAKRFEVENYGLGNYMRTRGELNCIYITENKKLSITPKPLRLYETITLNDLQKYCDIDLSKLIMYVTGTDSCYILNKIHTEEEDEHFESIKEDINEKYTEIVNKAMTAYILDNYVNKCNISMDLKFCHEQELSARYIKQLLHSPVADACVHFDILKNRYSGWESYDNKNEFLKALITANYIDDPNEFISL